MCAFCQQTGASFVNVKCEPRPAGWHLEGFFGKIYCNNHYFGKYVVLFIYIIILKSLQ